jgi:hypothetical protein
VRIIRFPDRVDDDVAAAHRQAGTRVAHLIADQLFIARVLEGEQLDREQQHEGGNRVDDQVDHGERPRLDSNQRPTA